MTVSLRDSVAILAESAADVAPLIRSRVGTLPTEVRHLAGLHFGWWDDNGTASKDPPTYKFLRPTLVMSACRAVGGNRKAALNEAVAVELIHNASLLHDDVIDRDPLRRGRPALWAAKGVPAAILAGDALFFAAVEALLDSPRAAETIPVLLASVQALIEGEYRDCLQEAATHTTPDQALSVAAAKTGELLACACALGALAGGADEEQTEHLRAFGHHLGIAFQCVDDVLGIWGDQATMGKSADSDLRARKLSLPVAAAMAGPSLQARQLRALYRQDRPLDDAQCHRARELLEASGAKETTLRLARRHARDAVGRLVKAGVPGSDLGALLDLAVHRDH